MKIFWRLSSTAVFFFFLSSKKLHPEQFEGLTRSELLIDLPLAASSYAAMNTLFAVSLEFTTLTSAVILSNMASLIMIGAKLGLREHVLFFEGTGALVGVAGALICNLDHSGGVDDRETSDGQLKTLGNLLAFGSSVGVAIYLMISKKLRPKIDLVFFMMLLFALASAFQLAYIALFCEQAWEFSADKSIGLFGWLDPQMDRLPLEIWLAVVCNGIGTMGYVAVMKYFDPVVVSMVMLMEPIVATVQGVLVGASELPGWITWVGDAVVMAGSILVIWSGSRSVKTIDATEALQQQKDLETSFHTKTSFGK